MKILLPLLAIILAGCQSDESQPEEPKPKSEAEVRAFLAKQAHLLNKKHGFEKQLNKLVSAKTVDPSGKMKVIFEERQQAIIDLQNIRNNHPNLQKLNADLKSWQGHQRSAILSKREAEAQEAREKILEITGKLHSLSKELPAIREAEDQIQRSEKTLSDLRRSLAEKTPEGQALMQEIKKIEAELSTLQ